MTRDDMRATPVGRGAVRLVAALIAAYMISQFYRTSNAVIAPELVHDLGLSVEALGMLTGAFFLVFAMAQIPIGVLLDRFGPRRTISGMLSFAVVGALVFAGADTAAGLALGRALLGLGCASVFMGSLVVVARWFPPDRFSMFAALILSVGGTGSLLATTPLALAAEAVGWRGVFVGSAAITAAAGALVYAVVRDAPPGHPYHARGRETFGTILRGVGEVLTERRLPFLLIMSCVAPVAPTMLYLWAGTYLHDVHGLDGVGRGNVLFVIATALIVGTLCYGSFDRIFDTRKGVVVCGSLATAAILAVLALVPMPGPWQAAVMLGLLGLVGNYGVVILTHGRAIFPDRLVGRAVTVVNSAIFFGIAALQIVIGLIIGAFTPLDGVAPEAAYRTAFAFLAAAIALALVFYLRVDDVKPSHGLRAEPGEHTEGA